ncbi:MAG: hypothetical protein IJZ35_02080 [Clostridia bacterium]|nr:hypothetical protein [Clostridia bacterium]
MKTRKKSARFLSVVLSVVMLLSSMSVMAFAAHDPYLDNAILDQYNSIDKVDLELTQKASILLDMLDVMLEDEDIYIDIPLIGDINLRSTDEALDSIYDLTGNWLFGRLTVGDLVVLETNRDDISSVRRTTAGKTDVDVINSLVTYLGNCAPTLVGIIDDSFSWGIVKGFLPPEFRVIIDDLPGFLKETIWDLLHPVNDELMPSDITLDDLVQFMCDNQLGAEEGSERAEIMGFAGVMPGFDIDIDSVTGYAAIEEAIFHALNEFVVPLLNDELKTVIQDAVESNANDGGSLDELVNVDYVVETYEFDDNKTLMEQLNDVFGAVVEDMLLPGTYTWIAVPADGDYIATLETNLTALLKQIIVAGGETEDVSGYSLEQLGDYIARVAVEQFVKHMDLQQGDTMERIAYLGLRELCASIIPENVYPDVPADATAEGYRNAIIEIAADLGTFYLNNNIGLNCDMDTNASEFLTAFATWCLPYVDGLYDATAYNTADTGWEKIDAILWEIIPKNLFSYDEMFRDAEGAGEAGDLGLQSLVNYILDAIFAFDLEKIDAFFTHSPNSILNGSARQAIIDVVRNIINGAFTPTGADYCVPPVTTFEAVISVANLKTIAENLLVSLKDKNATLVPTAINLVTMLMGAADPQSLGDVALDINSRIYCENGTVPSGQTIRVSNLSDGVNSAWRNAAGTLTQDKMYEIELVALTNNAGLTTAAIPENTKIAANAYYDIAVSGSVAATTEVRFDLSYYILDEAGVRLNTTPLVTSTYAHFYKETGNYDVTSAAIGETNRVSFDSFSTYLYTTDVYDASLFSIMATNNGVLIGNAVRDIRRAIVTGTLPTGLSANNPADGPIISIDAASLTVDSYGTVNPYVANIDPDLAQPYGIYDLDIAFEVCSSGSNSGTVTETRDHIIVIYNDFGLPGVLDDVMGANRQRADYLDTADAEWTAYQTAVSEGYALLHGNPDHSKMFADVTAPDGSANAYAAAVAAIEAAVAALDEKVKPTDATLLATLEASVTAQADVKREDYVLFTYDRWDNWYDHASGLVNSQTVAEGETAPAIPAFDLIYAEHMVELMYPRLIKKAVVKTHLASAIAAADEKIQAAYTTDSWTDFAAALAAAKTVNEDTSVTLLQTQVNNARVELMKAMRRLVRINFLEALDDTVVIDNSTLFITGFATECTDIEEYVIVVESYENNYYIDYVQYDSASDYYGTGSEVTVYDENDEPIVTYTIVVSGDVNGDGRITSSDIDVYDNYFGNSQSTAFDELAFFVAGDVNNDGIINSVDKVIVNDLV